MSNLSYSKKLIIINLAKIIATLIALSILVALAFDYSIKGILAGKIWTNPQSLVVVTFFFFGFIIAWIELRFLDSLNRFWDNTIYNLKNALKGNAGEKKTFERLMQMLGPEYKIYSNFKVPRQRFDIDTLIIGPKGIITFEIKNLGNKYDRFRFEGADMYKISRYQNGNECVCKMGEYGNSNPIKEAIRHNLVLEEWLMKNGFGGIKVKGAVMMVGDGIIENTINPALYIIKGFDDIKRFIDNTFIDNKFTPEFFLEINKLFTDVK